MEETHETVHGLVARTSCTIRWLFHLLTDFTCSTLNLTTAVIGLFHKDYLALDLPTRPAQKSDGELLLITGGITSVGGNTVQMAKSNRTPRPGTSTTWRNLTPPGLTITIPPSPAT